MSLVSKSTNYVKMIKLMINLMHKNTKTRPRLLERETLKGFLNWNLNQCFFLEIKIAVKEVKMKNSKCPQAHLLSLTKNSLNLLKAKRLLHSQTSATRVINLAKHKMKRGGYW